MTKPRYNNIMRIVAIVTLGAFLLSQAGPAYAYDKLRAVAAAEGKNVAKDLVNALGQSGVGSNAAGAQADMTGEDRIARYYNRAFSQSDTDRMLKFLPAHFLSLISSSEPLRGYVCHKIGDNNSGRVVLSIGIGSGALERDLIDNYGVKVIGVDLVEKLLKRADGRIEKIVGNGEKLPLADNSVDIVIFSESIGHMALAGALKEAHRVLKPGGSVHILTYRPLGVVGGAYLLTRAPYRPDSKKNLISAMNSAGFVDSEMILLPLAYSKALLMPKMMGYIYVCAEKAPATGSNAAGSNAAGRVLKILPGNALKMKIEKAISALMTFQRARRYKIGVSFYNSELHVRVYEYVAQNKGFVQQDYLNLRLELDNFDGKWKFLKEEPVPGKPGEVKKVPTPVVIWIGSLSSNRFVIPGLQDVSVGIGVGNGEISFYNAERKNVITIKMPEIIVDGKPSNRQNYSEILTKEVDRILDAGKYPFVNNCDILEINPVTSSVTWRITYNLNGIPGSEIFETKIKTPQEDIETLGKHFELIAASAKATGERDAAEKSSTFAPAAGDLKLSAPILQSDMPADFRAWFFPIGSEYDTVLAWWSESGRGQKHEGLDFARYIAVDPSGREVLKLLPRGTPVRSIAGGRVTRIFREQVEIQNDDGFYFLCAHIDVTWPLNVGDRVKEG